MGSPLQYCSAIKSKKIAICSINIDAEKCMLNITNNSNFLVSKAKQYINILGQKILRLLYLEDTEASKLRGQAKMMPFRASCSFKDWL